MLSHVLSLAHESLARLRFAALNAQRSTANARLLQSAFGGRVRLNLSLELFLNYCKFDGTLSFAMGAVLRHPAGVRSLRRTTPVPGCEAASGGASESRKLPI